jgi:hypothetical protein
MFIFSCKHKKIFYIRGARYGGQRIVLMTILLELPYGRILLGAVLCIEISNQVTKKILVKL